MGIKITPEEKVREYYEDDGLNQSLLKSLAYGLNSFLTAKERQEDEEDPLAEEKLHFTIGKGVDIQLTGENEAFEKMYYVSELEKKPSDVEMAVTKMVFNDVTEEFDEGEYGNLEDHPGKILDAVNELNWQSRWKAETRISKIVETCSLYYEDLKKAHGKQVISKEQNDIISAVVMSFKTNPRTAHLFDREVQEKYPNVDVYYQLAIEWKHKGIKCKALLDMVFVFMDEKGNIERILPFDVKTMSGHTIEFPKAIKARRYDFQAAWYSFGLAQFFNVPEDLVMNFKFVVESTTHPGTPLVYEMTDDLLHIGRYGRPEMKLLDTDLINTFEKNQISYTMPIMVYSIKGFEQLVDEYLWYEENGWEEDRLIAQSSEVLKVDWNGIVELEQDVEQ